MSDRILDKYLGPGGGSGGGRASHEHESPTTTDGDAADDLGCFGYLRGVRDRSVMLELRRSDGSIFAVGYAWMDRANFDPDKGITLHLSGRTVRITGRNLNGEVRPHVRLFHGIARHRVPWLRQSGERELMAAQDDAVVIESIDWTESDGIK